MLILFVKKKFFFYPYQPQELLLPPDLLKQKPGPDPALVCLGSVRHWLSALGLCLVQE